jgi:ATP-dependent phosphofructokinase / diphosphate-dependent phosphofructokinase
MARFNAFYAQSGGVTAVINATACGVIEAARKNSDRINKVYAGKNGILGALNNNLIDTSLLDDAFIASLKHTPGGAFGSCRFKLDDPKINKTQYEKIISVFKEHDIGYFFYNGGGDSQDTTHKLSEHAKSVGYDLKCIGLPKTIDNDLPYTDFSPGFPSTAKYVAISTLEAGLDVVSMAAASTKVFILEVMGRNAGWIAAAAALASKDKSKPPHIILFPEVAFDSVKFLNKVDMCVKKYGFCTIVAAEGIKNSDGIFLSMHSEAGDSFGHNQLGGVSVKLASLIKDNLGYKYHFALADYLQRSARHIASKVDVDCAYNIGEQAVERALSGKTGVMLTLNRFKSKEQTKWVIGEVALNKVCNVEINLPENYIDSTGFGITQECRDYLGPLIQGEAYPPYKDGLPEYGDFLYSEQGSEVIADS